MAVLCVSRQFGSGGEEIGRAVAEQLGYDFVDKARVLDEMKGAGERWERLSRDLDEACPTIWERYDWEYRGFVALVGAYLYKWAERDRAVLMGRGGNVLLQGIAHALLVRFVAPLEARLDRVMVRDSVDRGTAEWLIQKMDHDKACYIQTNYGRHWDDRKNYDLVIDTTRQSQAKVVRDLIDALKERDRRATDASRNLLKQRSLAAWVRAKIATDSRFFIPTLEVEHDGEAVVLKGIIHNQRELELAQEVARQVCHPTPVKNLLHYRG
jgi:cytidylate kinase